MIDWLSQHVTWLHALNVVIWAVTAVAFVLLIAARRQTARIRKEIAEIDARKADIESRLRELD